MLSPYYLYSSSPQAMKKTSKKISALEVRDVELSGLMLLSEVIDPSGG